MPAREEVKPALTLKSDFAILDVKAGRAALAKHFASRPALGPCPEDMRVPVIIVGFIDGIHSRDDGVSREFLVDVTAVEITKAEAR